jgi:hypothetical protein
VSRRTGLPQAARRALPATAAIVGVAVALRLIYHPWYGNYDTRYALLWARDALRGLTPDYTTPFAPTPHPLETAVSTLGVAFGDQVMVWIPLLCFGALVWVVYRLGAELFSPGAGVVAALVVLTRPVLLRGTVLGYQDTAFALVIVSAVLLEARRPRRGVPVLALLVLAGLMRPEAWVLAGLYVLYLWRSRTPRERAALAALAALAPALWALSDLVVTGDLLHSLHGTAALAEDLDRPREIEEAPYWAAVYYGAALREPLLIGIPIGLAFAWRHRMRQAVLPLAVVAVITAVFVIGPLFGLPLISRYVRTPAVLLTVFYGLAVVGWRGLPAGRERTRWKWAGIAAAALSIAFLPWHAAMLEKQHQRLQRDNRLYVALRTAAQAPQVRAAFERCGGIATADNRPIPFVRWWIDGPPGSVRTVLQGQGRLGELLIAPRRSRNARRFYGKRFPRVDLPAGWRTIYQNRSWRVSAGTGCPVRGPG